MPICSPSCSPDLLTLALHNLAMCRVSGERKCTATGKTPGRRQVGHPVLAAAIPAGGVCRDDGIRALRRRGRGHLPRAGSEKSSRGHEAQCMEALLQAEGVGQAVREAHANRQGHACSEGVGVWTSCVHFCRSRRCPSVNLLLSTYWTIGAVRNGDYIAKVRVAPVQEFAERGCAAKAGLRLCRRGCRPALVAELGARPYEFDVQVQLCADIARCPWRMSSSAGPRSFRRS